MFIGQDGIKGDMAIEGVHEVPLTTRMYAPSPCSERDRSHYRFRHVELDLLDHCISSSGSDPLFNLSIRMPSRSEDHDFYDGGGQWGQPCTVGILLDAGSCGCCTSV